MNQTEINAFNNWVEEKLKNAENSSVNEIMSALMTAKGRIFIKNDSKTEIIYKFIQAYMMESEDKRRDFFLNNNSLDELSVYDDLIKMILYRIYSDDVDEELFNLIDVVLQNNITVYVFLVYSGYFNRDGDRIIIKLSDILFEMGQMVKSIYLLNAALKMYSGNEEIVLKLSEKYINIGMNEEARELLSRLGKKED